MHTPNFFKISEYGWIKVLKGFGFLNRSWLEPLIGLYIEYLKIKEYLKFLDLVLFSNSILTPLCPYWLDVGGPHVFLLFTELDAPCRHCRSFYQSKNTFKKVFWIKNKRIPFNLCVYLVKLVKSFIDENDGDEDGEDLLGKTRDEADEETSLCCYHNQHNDDQPHSNPYTTHNVVELIRMRELTDGQTQTGQHLMTSFNLV